MVRYPKLSSRLPSCGFLSWPLRGWVRPLPALRFLLRGTLAMRLLQRRGCALLIAIQLVVGSVTVELGVPGQVVSHPLRLCFGLGPLRL